MTSKLSSYVTDSFRLILQNFQAAFGGQKPRKPVAEGGLIGCSPPAGQRHDTLSIAEASLSGHEWLWFFGLLAKSEDLRL